MSATARRLQKDAELVGVSAYLGQRLRQAMSDLDTVRDLPTQIQRTRRELDESAALAWQIRQEREDLPPLEDAVRDATAAVAVDMSPGARERLRGVFVTQRELLDRLMADYDELATQLSALLTAQSGFESQIDELSDFVAENVLWVRSSVPLTSSRPPSDWRRLPDQLARLALVYLGDMLTHPTTDLAAAVFLLGLAAARRRLRAQMNDLAQRVSSAYTDRYRYTWAAAVLTVLLAVPIPLLLWYLAWRVPGLSTNSDSDALAAALGFGCARAALVVVMFSLIQQVCRPAGLGESHFRWDRSDLRLVRREVGWLKWITGPVVLVVATCELLPDEGWRDWVGRIAWLGGMAALPIFAQRVLHPQRGLGAARPARARATLFDRTRAYWYWFGLLFPGVLAVLSIVGYQYTAISLLRLIVRTVWLMLGLVLLQSLLVRWLFVAQRRIALEQARRRAAEVQNQPAESSERPPVDDEKLNLVSLGDQTRQLLRSAVATGFVIGLWLIWNDALPALKILDAVQIGSYAVETAVPGPDGVARTVSTVQRVTLNHAALAVVISFVTFLLARNIPALIEIILLQKLPIDAGGRYAVTAIARYAITILGVLTAFSAVGVGWSQVQWLAAAVSVGLGFGLQEIFANFVSGLMLLFERPIRIGDTVTVGNVTGVVTRIRIRATTITDWDRKDLIIPNREFITGQVINWTLTDSTLRLVIPVGVAYGTEPARVERELLAAARRERLVLDDPPPRVVFTSFGESSLNFELRVFTTVDNVVDTRHALMQSLNEALQKAGIEIAYPQREVRIRNETPAPASGMAAPAAAAKASGMS
jgi:potassium efflux system protein